MKVSPARQAAFDILRRVETEEAFASHLLAASRYDALSREDHALAQELTLGVLRWQGQLDFLIEHFARRPITRLDFEVVIALRLGLYQLRFLSRIPAHAVINESVNLVKAQKKTSAAPLVNAVLRAAQRTDSDTVEHLINSIRDPLQRLSVETSHPVWLLQRWISRFGVEEAKAFALANNAVPRTSFRWNEKRASVEQTRAWLAAHNIVIHESAIVPGAFVIESGSLSANAEPLQQGWLYLQDEASQLVAHLACERNLSKFQSTHPQPASQSPQSASSLPQALRNPQFLDVCAAPGSKTTLAASLLPNDALIVAGDLHAHRLRTMQQLVARLDVTNLNLLQFDAARALPFNDSSFDAVLLDAPCSGLGTLQRHPEIKWKASETKIHELAALQTRLLENSAQQVRPGGLLTYSVCSTEPEEGEDIITQFRQQHAEYRDVTRERLTELGLAPEALLTATHGARTFSHRHQTESFFVCVLWKRR